MSDDLIAEGRALLEAATVGPWETHEVEPDWWWVWQANKLPNWGAVLEPSTGYSNDGIGAAIASDNKDSAQERADAELIVWMRNNLPVILDELEEARAAYSKLHADTQEGWARIAARQQRDAQRIRDLEQQLASGGAS